MVNFELAVSQHLARARALEKALHDDGPWCFRVSNWTPETGPTGTCGIPVTRRVEPENLRVVFSAELWSNDYQWVPIDLMTVRDREIVTSKDVWLPIGGSLVEWELSLPEPVAA